LSRFWRALDDERDLPDELERDRLDELFPLLDRLDELFALLDRLDELFALLDLLVERLLLVLDLEPWLAISRPS
jgi:hypothetical protein